MKLRTLLITLMLASVCSYAGAAGKNGSKKKKASIEVTDSLAYAFGKANTAGLKQYLVQRMNLDTTYLDDFMKGFQTEKFSKKDLREKARLAGMEIRNQVETQIYPSINKQLGDTVNVLDKALFVQGFTDGICGEEGAMSIEDATAMAKKHAEAAHKAQAEEKHKQNLAEGENFLKENAKKPGVKTTASGLQYKILTEGTGKIPSLNSKVKVNYEGKLLDGTVFDSTYKRNRPITFGCGHVIKGWSEALCMMPVGSKWELYIPQELGYGEHEQGKIPPFSTLIFTVELLDIEE